MSQVSLSQNETSVLLAFDTCNSDALIKQNLQFNDSNRTLNVVSPRVDNQTNDIVIDIKQSPLRLPSVMVSIGSLEIPMTQLTVERLWNQLFYSEFYEPLNSALSTVSVEYTLLDGTKQVFDGTIPLLVNPIVSVNTTIVTPGAPGVISVQFETEKAHGLSIADFYDWSGTNSNIQLLGTPINQSLSSSNSSFQIVDEFKFNLLDVKVSDTAIVTAQLNTANPTTGYYGFVYAPPIPGPVQLTQLATAALHVDPILEQNQVGFTFVPTLHKTTFQFLPLIGNSLTTGEQKTNTELAYQNPTLRNYGNVTNNWNKVILSSSARNIPADRVITSVTLIVPNTAEDSLPLQLGYLDPTTLTVDRRSQNSVSYFHFSMLRLDPANYLGTSMVQQLDLQWNRLYFERPETGSVILPGTYNPKFAFGDTAGVTQFFYIPFGYYSPQNLCLFLQAQMNALDSLGNTYSVTFQQDSFTFSSTQGKVFSLEFGLIPGITQPLLNPYTGGPTLTLPIRLGFQLIAYRGKSSYSSPVPVYVPVQSAFSQTFLTQSTTGSNQKKFQDPTKTVLPPSSSAFNDPYPHSTSLIWQPTFDITTQKFSFNTVIPKASVGTISSVSGVPTLTLTDAQTFYPKQLVTITFTDSKVLQSFTVPIVTATNAFTYAVDPGSLYSINLGTLGRNWSTLASDPITVELAFAPTGNLFMGPAPVGAQQLWPSILGFPPVDFVWLGTETPDFEKVNLVGDPQTDFATDMVPLTQSWTFQTYNFKNQTSLFPLVAPMPAELEGPSYLLVQITAPEIASHFQHRYKSDLKVNLLGKVILHANPGCYKLERFLHVQGLFGGAYSMLTSFRIRLLNPNHTLYQLHNKNWSGTLHVTALQDRIQLLK